MARDHVLAWIKKMKRDGQPIEQHRDKLNNGSFFKTFTPCKNLLKSQ